LGEAAALGMAMGVGVGVAEAAAEAAFAMAGTEDFTSAPFASAAEKGFACALA
jgi:hypothetical protein